MLRRFCRFIGHGVTQLPGVAYLIEPIPAGCLPFHSLACPRSGYQYFSSVPARVLVLFAHPALQKSRINVHLASAARGVAGITFHDLYEAYPDFDIDVPREQALLRDHDIIVFQHPFYWYSCPALLKEWLDLVLEYGFAYGPGGNALAGKSLLSALTTGGPTAAYTLEGTNRFTMTEFLIPFIQTAALCGMNWLPPFVIHGTIRIAVADAIADHAGRYAQLLSKLRDGRA